MYKRSFLKWAGGKYRALNHVLPALPQSKRLVEPFVGSGTVFLNTDYEEYLLADNNPHLIQLMEEVARSKTFIMIAEKLFGHSTNNSEVYYRYREDFNRNLSPVNTSALLVYLNRHCFNGLYRVNQKGEFNVPFGRYKNPKFPKHEMVFFHEKVLQSRVEFRCTDFRKVFEEVIETDVVYCDPPYIPLTSDFNYSQGGFNREDHEELAYLAANNPSKATVVSNHYTPLTMEIYGKYPIKNLKVFEVARSISSNGRNRQRVKEVLITY